MRTLKDKEHHTKRQEILATALELLLAKGYEAMSIQDILDARQISKGAFYHYFDSKQALLTATVDQMRHDALPRLTAIVEDASLTAPQKFQRYFEASLEWKQENSRHTKLAMQLWHSDRSTTLRQKVSQDTLRYTAPLIESMIRQGIKERVFTTRYPHQLSLMIAGLAVSLTDEIASRLLSVEQPEAAPATELIKDLLMAYTESVERMLSAKPGSLVMFDR